MKPGSRRCPKCTIAWSNNIAFCPYDGAQLDGANLNAPADGDDGRAETARDREVHPSMAPGEHEPGPPDEPTRPSATLGPFRLVRMIGRGAMADVFEAVHERTGRRHAIKVLNPELAQKSDVVRRFFKEGRAVNRIRHPNIVDISDFVEGGSHPPYLVMELIEGELLCHVIHKQAPLAPDTAVDIALQVADALAAVHRVGIVHRDLKPENILVTRDRKGRFKVKLLDFGIAKFTDPQEDHLTRPGQLFGTAEYMSPEQIRGGAVDHRIDVYALGVILYEMLSGRRPFGAPTIMELFAQILKDPPRPPSVFLLPPAPAVPGDLEAVVLACLAKNPRDRIRDMDRLGVLLRRVMRGKSVSDGLKQKPSPAARRNRRLIASGSALVGAAGLLGWLALGPVGQTARGPFASAILADASVGETTSPGDTQRPPSPKSFTLRSEPSGVSIYRLSDGRYVGRTPTAVPASPGRTTHYLLRRNGYEDRVVSVDGNPSHAVTAILLVQDTPRTAEDRRSGADRRRRRPKKQPAAEGRLHIVGTGPEFKGPELVDPFK